MLPKVVSRHARPQNNYRNPVDICPLAWFTALVMAEKKTNTLVSGSERCQRKSLADKLCHNGRSDPSLQTKRCSHCRGLKNLSEFYRRKRSSDGRQHICKECSRIRCAEYFATNRDKVRAYKTQYRASHKEERRISWHRYYMTHREALAERKAVASKTVKGRARNSLIMAVYLGNIIKPSHCSSCGRGIERRLLHGHHEDYTKPLDVVWLCPACHGKRHRKDAE